MNRAQRRAAERQRDYIPENRRNPSPRVRRKSESSEENVLTRTGGVILEGLFDYTLGRVFD